MLHDGDVLKNLLMSMIVSGNGGSPRRLPCNANCNSPMLKPSTAEGKQIGAPRGKNHFEPMLYRSL
jgi:hypothetical protein